MFSVEGLGFKVLVSRSRFERLGFGDLEIQFKVDGVDPSSSGWTIRARACSSSHTTPACPSPASERDYTPSVQWTVNSEHSRKDGGRIDYTPSISTS